MDPEDDKARHPLSVINHAKTKIRLLRMVLLYSVAKRGGMGGRRVFIGCSLMEWSTIVS